IVIRLTVAASCLRRANNEVPRAFDVPVAPLGAEITARERAPIALKIRLFDRDDRPFYAHVLIRQRLHLRAQTESARALQQLSLSRPSSSYDSDLAPRLVGIKPHRLTPPPSRGRSVKNICAGCWGVMRRTRALAATACVVTPQAQKTGISFASMG